MRAVILGLTASLFFAATFLFNRTMSLDGGSWVWSASLRFLWMVPMLWGIVAIRGKTRDLWRVMRERPGTWVLWSWIGFGLFYIPLCYAASFGPAWLLASTWQVTILAGAVMGRWIGRPASSSGAAAGEERLWPTLVVSAVMLTGIALVELQHARAVPVGDALLAAGMVLLAAIAYPLGNRQMMAALQGRLHAYERTFGMTLASLPLWVGLAAYGWWTQGPPPPMQTGQTFLVALMSGVIATVLFFSATDLARNSQTRLAAVEATQAGEVVFTALAEWALLPDAQMSAMGMCGMALVVVGMVLHSYRVRLGRGGRYEQVRRISTNSREVRQ
ncbi:multidrug resistance efflux transporter family protein [Alicyclobacillus sp.]|uniref:DMT family transporter n=1 Tax=Alicyclobacillus sp. TaxID=61169 RepID=UPI0025BFA676|nr:multidrug resistance efflux transporter family protein [Alicyclobacillus sp.]MCL6515510.1 multidrug resistance efflux transporter family protein [Alicyclobacillus sp.]